MASLRWSCAILVVALFIAATTISVAQAQAPDAAEWLAAHNAARSAEAVGLPPLTWNTSAYEFALSWAQNRSATPGCAMDHSPNTESNPRPYGENIAWWTDATTTPTLVVRGWVAEKINYTYSSNTCVDGQVCGHYTQVVWKTTTSVGCASVPVGPAWVCDGHTGGRFYICDYYPPGNMPGARPY